ncbi:probable E3 ubiquitin-protein ligase RHG1A isoform X1 [Daucus carota subsp. sativus]|uniref:probable E3 ubiquitin-protein ligase RHG1A isoform X1 n=1 Tax=Daucus carota subsp. sativus TaxID=79200 RepID=UPI0007EFD10C|nr:PREDICTED: probable E3 ubiquitin-protein ligase RHG1A isoform X1 [Daucus carota subsp. sativus]XP_017253502.1 PREDICTED: probable E3 ubiquitin-protein ligase RHG1A isoform X1 [Daucus carota subsp. sativus]
MQSSQQNQLPDYMSLSNTAFTYLNATNSEGQNVSVGNTSGSSSIAAQSLFDHGGQNSELVWGSSMIGSSGVGPIRQSETASVFPVNAGSYSYSQNANGPVFVQSSAVSQDFNINAGSGEQGSDDCQIVERPNIFKSGSSVNARLPSSGSSSNPYGLHLGGYVEDRDGRPGSSSAGRHLSRKRKAMDGDIGQSSGSGTSNYYQQAGGSAWHTARPNASNSLNISLPSDNASGTSQLERFNQGFQVSAGGIPSEIPPAVTAARTSESSHRNLRLRFSSSHQLDSSPANAFAAGTAVGPVDYFTRHQPQRSTPVNGPLDLLPPAITSSGIMQSQSSLAHVPVMHHNLQSARWNRNSSLRPGSSSGVAIPGDNQGIASHYEARSRILQQNMLEHHMFIPSGMTASTQSQGPWGLTSGNNIAVSAAAPHSVSAAAAPQSVSAAAPHNGSAAGSNPTSAPNAVRIRNSPQHSRRLSELVRRSLLSSSGIQSGGQTSNALSGTPASAQGTNIPSGDQGHHLPQSRSANLPTRRYDGAFGIPVSLRTLAAATAPEGRSRLVSEQIRNVLAQMRRGEGLRFEDIMMLDQSVLFGMADHDGHRDMRLDIDNMSYEELLALEDRIGYVNTGLSENAMKKCLKKRKYKATSKDQKESEPCCICQEEYVNGDELGKLKCGHDFHTDCIKQWLKQKNLCPICKATTGDTKEK